MATLMQVIGYGWALLGLGNIVGMMGQGPGEGVAAFGLVVNVVLFILPGLGLGAAGTALKRRSSPVTAKPSGSEPSSSTLCGQCGAALSSGVRFCGACGAPTPNTAP